MRRRTFLKCLAVYLFIGCLVTANVLSNMKLMRGGAEPAIFVLALGPFIWPALLPQRISEIMDELETERDDARKEQDAFTQNMQTCPAGFEPICRKYFTRRIMNDTGAYAGLITALQNGFMPADEAGQDLVFGMADLYGAGEKPLRVKNDVLALLDEAPESNKASLRLAGAALLLGSLGATQDAGRYEPEADIWIPASREPCKDETLAAERAPIFQIILDWYGEATPQHSTPSLGLATLYDAYANVLSDAAMQKYWRDKALTEYEDAALRLDKATDVANALEGFCALAENDEAKINLLRDVRSSRISGRMLKKEWADYGWPRPLWRLPFNGTDMLQPPAGGNFLKWFLLHFKDDEKKIEAVGLLLEIFRKTGAWSDFDHYFLRESIYALAGKDEKPDRRWADMLLNLLERHDQYYAQRRLFYEAERAWFLGDQVLGERLLREYMTAHGKSGANYTLFLDSGCRSVETAGFCNLFHDLSR